MVRRSTLSNRARLSVTQLETREVPAGMIDVVSAFGNISITGDANDNYVRAFLTSNAIIESDSGPMRYSRFVGEVWTTTIEYGSLDLGYMDASNGLSD